ncbi:PREDICTED: uncharacterized protein LOC106750831 [Dinoponera quadriceps]|uniref:Uncharacterized protein LOC106750831 n=1 Tax=Dinoponera quadriceps TaxID=609295 RepID=A0A6P3Y967_DINQU|nr:PREDICTED: uncharacterized protein LOC106750831 [Dinoponera quadriceps]
MQMNEPDAGTSRSHHSQEQIVAGNIRREERDGTSAKREVINDSGPGTSQTVITTPIIPETTTDSAGTQQAVPSGSGGSPKLTRTMSRTEAVRQDVRRLKSVTLGRMGKIFKTRTPVVGGSALDANVTSVDNYDEEPSRKEKTNSLGRILKLVDKDGSPKKLFVRPRAGSLSRILRRHPHNEDNGVIDKSAEDTARGILSRMLSQLRGK